MANFFPHISFAVEDIFTVQVVDGITYVTYTHEYPVLYNFPLDTENAVIGMFIRQTELRVRSVGI